MLIRILTNYFLDGEKDSLLKKNIFQIFALYITCFLIEALAQSWFLCFRFSRIRASHPLPSQPPSHTFLILAARLTLVQHQMRGEEEGIEVLQKITRKNRNKVGGLLVGWDGEIKRNRRMEVTESESEDFKLLEAEQSLYIHTLLIIIQHSLIFYFVRENFKIQMKFYHFYHYGWATLKSFYHCHFTDKPLTTV